MAKKIAANATKKAAERRTAASVAESADGLLRARCPSCACKSKLPARPITFM